MRGAVEAVEEEGYGVGCVAGGCVGGGVVVAIEAGGEGLS